MWLALEHQNPSKTSEKMGYFDRVTVSLHILFDFQNGKQQSRPGSDKKRRNLLQYIYKDSIWLINRAK